MKLVRKQKRDGSGQVLLGKVILRERPSRKRDQGAEWAFSLEMLRLREIEAIIKHRHGNGIPDPAGSDDVGTCFAYLRAVALTPGAQDVTPWAVVWAPWASEEALARLAESSKQRKRMLGADAVAKLLFVTRVERSLLSLRTIGACDISNDERKLLAKEAKRELDRTRQEKKRRAEGRIARHSYQAASLSSQKPWEAEGVSRRTWERRRVASLSRVDIITIGDTLASKPSVQEPNGQDRAAGLSAGLGDHPPAGLQGAAPHGNSDVGGRAA